MKIATTIAMTISTITMFHAVRRGPLGISCSAMAGGYPCLAAALLRQTRRQRVRSRALQLLDGPTVAVQVLEEAEA